MVYLCYRPVTFTIATVVMYVGEFHQFSYQTHPQSHVGQAD